MKIGSIFHTLVFVMVVLIFGISFVTFAEQNSELSEAVIAAEQDAKVDVNQLGWWCTGCSGIGYIMALREAPQPSPARLIGKSPEYVEVYTQVYKAKVRNLRLSAAVPGCLTTALSPFTLFVFMTILENVD